MFLIGKDLITCIFTEKWGTEHTICILKVYSLYVAVLAIASLSEAYSNAVISSDKMTLLNSFMTVNAILLVVLSVILSQYDITGLVWANIITLFLRYFFNLYLTISSELEDQHSCKKYSSLSKEDNKLTFDDEEKDTLQCQPENNFDENISWTSILSEMAKFSYKSFMKVGAFVSTLVCLIILCIIKELLQYDDNKLLLLFSAGVILAMNIILIFMVEKKGFVEIIRLKSSGLKV
jgi:hypothetical protein